MKDFSYYAEIDMELPKRENFITYHYYKDGDLIETFHGTDTETRRKYTRQTQEHGGVIEKVFDKGAYTTLRKEYNSKLRDKEQEFKKDLLDEFGVSDHPKADKCFEVAWEKGHSSGFQEVYSVFDDLVDIIK